MGWLLVSVIIDLLGLTIADEEIELLKHPNTSGVILFTRNIKDREQLIALTQQIHAINPELILFIDHEGGYVQRIQRLGFRPLPAACIYGEVYDLNQAAGLKLAEQYGEHMAHELRQCGIHVGLAPVLDIHGPNPIIGGLYRAFHADPNTVTVLAAAFIKGMHHAGMPAIGKHFPGHGFCKTDSHIGFPSDERSLETLEACDLIPFKSLIDSSALDAVMPAHVTYPNIDATHAAGYSPMWLNDILREKMGFTGLIISDCLGMTGADIGDLLTRGKQALDAGCQLLIAANQTRPIIKDFLDTLPLHYQTSNEQHIARFKTKISPIKTIKAPQKTQATNASGHNQTFNATDTI
ncbi:MAG: beta-N-acetylhexosaminidase [Legionellaceae bacterium]|nr:beta-N-acetylhexosaminidase [Legionellaceae bacterium]